MSEQGDLSVVCVSFGSCDSDYDTMEMLVDIGVAFLFGVAADGGSIIRYLSSITPFSVNSWSFSSTESKS